MNLKKTTLGGKPKPSDLVQTPKPDKTNNIVKPKLTNLPPRDQGLDQSQLPLTQRTVAASGSKYSVKQLITNLEKLIKIEKKLIKIEKKSKKSSTREQTTRIRKEQWMIMKQIQGELNNATVADLTVLIKILPPLLNSHSPGVRYQAAAIIKQTLICCPTIPFPQTEIIASINTHREILANNIASNALSTQTISYISKTIRVLSDAMTIHSLASSPRAVEASAMVDTSVADVSKAMKDLQISTTKP